VLSVRGREIESERLKARETIAGEHRMVCILVKNIIFSIIS